MVKLTREEKKMYQVFSLLMGYAIGANITTMKQISIYVAKSTHHINVDTDCIVGINKENNCYELLLNDGRKISFSRNSNEFGFIVSKEEEYMSTSIIVSEQIPGDLTTTCVYGEVKIKDDGMYIISFRPKNFSDDNLKFGYINYYTDDEINWVYQIANEKINNNFDIVAKNNFIYPNSEERYFSLLAKCDNSFDCFNGLISSAAARVDLLCDNVRVIKRSSVRKKILDDKK